MSLGSEVFVAMLGIYIHEYIQFHVKLFKDEYSDTFL